MEKMEHSIRIRELTKDFSGKKVIDGICLDVSKGEIFGLLGPSGAGKTTLIKILTAQLKADGGKAELMGKMEEAASLCDHAALLLDGKIMEYGEPDVICRRYNGQNEIKILLKDKSFISLPNDSTSADLISRYIKEEQIESIHSSEPNLETVFMKLTGKGLIET